jgi:hypothetical protein
VSFSGLIEDVTYCPPASHETAVQRVARRPPSKSTGLADASYLQAFVLHERSGTSRAWSFASHPGRAADKQPIRTMEHAMKAKTNVRAGENHQPPREMILMGTTR